jgi:succinate dehydrogenase / fumarate reductase, iron-sulfur subunit
MTASDDATQTVTLRIHRFSPSTGNSQSHGSSPFTSRHRREGSPFDRDASGESTVRPSRAGSPFDRAARRRGSSPFGNSSAQGDANTALKARHPRIRGNKRVQDYTVEARPSDTLLDCLLTIKRTVDPTLSFRYSCGHGVCGSDAVSINGTPTLLCTATVGEFAKLDDANAQAAFRRISESKPNATSFTNAACGSQTDASGTGMAGTLTSGPNLGVVELAPLPGFPVVRDLIVDIDQMIDQIKALSPYLKADGKLATTTDGKIDMFEYLQSPEELKRIEILSNCISCGVCEGSCPVYAGGEAFVGPAALVSASRFVNDSRDTTTTERLEAIASQDGIAACQSVRACSRRCPRGIDVGEEMWRLTEQVNAR